jgi:hypothetical protein
VQLPYRKEAEVISFEHAWREGGIHRKRELQNALFPEGDVVDKTQGL